TDASDAAAADAQPLQTLPAGVCTMEGWCWRNPRIGDDLQAIWGSAPNDIWIGSAVEGTGFTPKAGAAVEGTLIHFDGTSWRGWTASRELGVSHLHGSAANDIWGITRDGLIHYDGARWTPFGSGTTYPLRRVHTVGPKDAWAIGDVGTIRRWDGTSWNEF